ncbi:TPA: glycosyltransferase [Vibrio diabolicus]|nr:glycosyltransferase [Vibrio diabolicus]
MSISVAIPVYNAEKYLSLAISSVLAQSYSDFELIILDDGSTDNSLAIAKSFDDERVRIISDGENLGLPSRLNQIIDISKFDFIARMDADDVIPPNRLEQQIAYLLDNPDKDLVTTGFAYVDDSNVRGVNIPELKVSYSLSDMLNNQHGICHASLLVRKSWYNRNKYDALMHRVEDYELWLRAFLNDDLKMGYISEVGYYYRSDNTLTKKKFISTFRSGFLVISKHSKNIPFLLKLKYKLKVNFKIFATNLIFLMDLQYKLLSKLDSTEIGNNIQKDYSALLKRLNQ